MGAFDEIIAKYGPGSAALPASPPAAPTFRSIAGQKDPRLLGSYGYSGDTIPPSQDQFYGQGISAQPTFLEKMLRMFGGSASDPGMGPQALETPLIGAVLNAKNAATIKQALASIVNANPGMSPTEIAAEFVKAKYPKLSGLSPVSIEPPPRFQFLRRLLGSFEQATGKTTLYDYPERNVEKSVNTLTHELTHANQARKDPIGLNTSYIPAQANFARYEAQPWEVSARQGGETGQGAFEKFKNMIAPPPTQLDLQTPVTARHINEVFLPAIAERLKKEGSSVYADLMKNNLRYNLGRAAQTATGNLGPYGQPFTLEEGIHAFSNISNRDPLYRGLAGSTYHGFSNPSFLHSAPADMRTFKDLLR